MGAFQTCYHDIEEDALHTHEDGHVSHVLATNLLHLLGTMREMPYQIIPQCYTH